MNIPVNLFMWVLACLPIIVLLVLMIRFQWGATDAAPIGLAHYRVYRHCILQGRFESDCFGRKQGNLECTDDSDYCMDSSTAVSGGK